MSGVSYLCRVRPYRGWRMLIHDLAVWKIHSWHWFVGPSRRPLAAGSAPTRELAIRASREAAKRLHEIGFYA